MSHFEPRLTQYEPVDAIWCRLELGQWGWELTIGHRHQCGQHGDCQTEKYPALTLGEAFDIVEATLLTVGHSG